MGSFSQEVPHLLPVLQVLPEPAVSAGFGLALDLTLGSPLALDLALAESMLPGASRLSIGIFSALASLATLWGSFRKAMVVPASSRWRLASMPTPTRSGTTS